MPSMRTVAKQLNVSATTVSRALNNKPGISQATREQVLKAMQEIGYNRRVGLRNSRYLGFVYPPDSFKTIIGLYHGALMGGIRSAISSQHYDFAMVDLISDKENNENFTQYFARKELQGVIMQARPEDLPIVKEISDEGFPIILVSSHGTDKNHSVNWVACESREPTRQAVKHLIDIGHRKIAFTTGNWHSTDIEDRFLGYKDALAEADIPFDPTLVYQLKADVTAGMGVIRQIMSHPSPPTALVLTTPYTTLGALRACREMKLNVPEDISILGFDDYQTRFMANPVYSSVCQDSYQLGYDAGTALLQVLSGKTTQPIEITHQAVFEVHETTGVPRKEAVIRP